MPKDGKWKLEGYDTFKGAHGEDASYPFGNPDGYDTRELAKDGARAELDTIETRPSAPSVGQGGLGSIQDRIFLVAPGGSKERFFG